MSLTSCGLRNNIIWVTLKVVILCCCCAAQNEDVRIKLKYEATSRMLLDISIKAEHFITFRDALFNQNTTNIIINYMGDNTTWLSVKIKSSQQYPNNSSCFGCFNNKSDLSMQCSRELNKLCCNHPSCVGIGWSDIGEYMDSIYFHNKTLTCGDKVNITFYTLKNDTFSSECVLKNGTIVQNVSAILENTSKNLEATTTTNNSSSIIIGVVVSVAVVVVICASIVVWKRKKDADRSSVAQENHPKCDNLEVQVAKQLSILNTKTTILNSKSKCLQQIETDTPQAGMFTSSTIVNTSVASLGSTIQSGTSDYITIIEGLNERPVDGLNSTADDLEDRYNYIHGDTLNRNSVVSGSNIYHNISDYDKINPEISHDKDPRYDYVKLENTWVDDKGPTKNKNSKLREESRSPENAYVNLNHSPDEDMRSEYDTRIENTEDDCTDVSDVTTRNTLENTYIVPTEVEYDLHQN